MTRSTQSRVLQLERRLHVNEPEIGRLLFLLPDLWPEEDQAAVQHPADREALAELIERRTGVRPSFDLRPVWAITVPVPQEMLAWDDAEKADFLEAHESRPIQPGQWEWRGNAIDDAPADA